MEVADSSESLAIAYQTRLHGVITQKNRNLPSSFIVRLDIRGRIKKFPESKNDIVTCVWLRDQ
jgi:hypothetical protein